MGLPIEGEVREITSENGPIKITKEIPQVGNLLLRVDDYFGPTNGYYPSDFLIETSSLYADAYKRWESVRKKRAKELIGESNVGTGAEGWVAGFCPKEIIRIEAEATSIAWSDMVSLGRYESLRRNRMEKAIRGEADDYIDITALLDAQEFFRYVRANILSAFENRATPDQKVINWTFRQRTETLVKGTLPVKYDFDRKTGILKQTYVLPNYKLNSTPLDKGSIPSGLTDTYDLLIEIGRIGMPIMRVLLDNPSARAALYVAHGGFNFAPKGSRVARIMQQRFSSKDRKNP